MRTALLVSALALIAIPVAGFAGEPNSREPLIAVDRGDGAKWLQLVDPVTLRPASRRMKGFRESFTAARSPDGRRLAVGSSFDRSAAIRMIDLRRQRSERIIELHRRGPVLVEWPTRDRVVAIVGMPGTRQEVFFVDPVAVEIRARHPFRGRLLAHEPTATGVAILIAPQRGLGPARLLVADASGAVRAHTLRHIIAGGNEGSGRRVRYRQPGLAIDAAGRRAYVVAARDRPLVAAVELSSAGQVEYHEPAERPSAGAAKGNIDVWWREAVQFGPDAIAVTGFRGRPARRGRRFPPPEEPYGVRLIDTTDWSIRTLAGEPNQLRVAGDRLLAHGTTWSAGWRTSRSTGLLVFDSEGRRLYTRFPGQDLVLAGATEELAYVWVRPTRTLHVLDLRDGRTLRRHRTRPRDIPFLLTP